MNKISPTRIGDFTVKSSYGNYDIEGYGYKMRFKLLGSVKATIAHQRSNKDIIVEVNRAQWTLISMSGRLPGRSICERGAYAFIWDRSNYVRSNLIAEEIPLSYPDATVELNTNGHILYMDIMDGSLIVQVINDAIYVTIGDIILHYDGARIVTI
jgi:hypothetical protein